MIVLRRILGWIMFSVGSVYTLIGCLSLFALPMFAPESRIGVVTLPILMILVTVAGWYIAHPKSLGTKSSTPSNTAEER